MNRANEVGPDPCRADGGCDWFEKCKDEAICCHSFRCYVAGKPQEGVDIKELRRTKGYRFYADRMNNMLSLPEFQEVPPTDKKGDFDGKF